MWLPGFTTETDGLLLEAEPTFWPSMKTETLWTTPGLPGKSGVTTMSAWLGAGAAVVVEVAVMMDMPVEMVMVDEVVMTATVPVGQLLLEGALFEEGEAAEPGASTARALHDIALPPLS